MDDYYDEITSLLYQNIGWGEIKSKLDYPKQTTSLQRSYYYATQKRKDKGVESSLENELAELNQEIEYLEKECSLIDEVKEARQRVHELRTRLNAFHSQSEPKKPRMVMPSESATTPSENHTPRNASDAPQDDGKLKSDTTHEDQDTTPPKNDLQDDLPDDFLNGITVEWDDEGNIKINDPLVESVRQAVDTGIDEEVIADALEITLDEVYDIVDWEEENDNKDFDNDDE